MDELVRGSGNSLYPFHDMGTAGWITTTVNYFWPVWGCSLSESFSKMMIHKKIGIMEGIAGVLVCLIASSHEQVAVILFVVLFCMASTWSSENTGRNL